jgi:hypothetical protein
VTALKALQRTSRETTKVLRVVEEAAKQPDIAVTFGKEKIGIAAYDGDVRVDQRYVSDLTTAELADELARRANVSDYNVTSNDRAVFKYRSDDNTEGVNFPFRGPAKVLVVSE